MIPAEALGGAMICLIVVSCVYFFWRYRRDSGRGEFDLEESLGGVGPLKVGVAFDGRHRRVELTLPHEGEEMVIEMHAYLTGSQARLVAGWLRVAAAPGRTVEEARRRTPKAPA